MSDKPFLYQSTTSRTRSLQSLSELMPMEVWKWTHNHREKIRDGIEEAARKGYLLANYHFTISGDDALSDKYQMMVHYLIMTLREYGYQASIKEDVIAFQIHGATIHYTLNISW